MNIFDFLKYYEGTVKVNGVEIPVDSREAIDSLCGDLKIELIPRNILEVKKYRIKVRSWLVNNDNFDFIKRWNNGVSMRCDSGTCEIIKSTPGMLYIDFYGDDGSHWEGYVAKAGVISLDEIN